MTVSIGTVIVVLGFLWVVFVAWWMVSIAGSLRDIRDLLEQLLILQGLEDEDASS